MRFRLPASVVILPALVLILSVLALPAGAEPHNATVVASGLEHPQSVAVADDGRIFVTVKGQSSDSSDKAARGAILVIEKGKTTPFTTGLNDPSGIIAYRDSLYVVERNQISRITYMKGGEAEPFAAAAGLPFQMLTPGALTVEFYKGVLYANEVGDKRGLIPAIYKIGAKGFSEVVVSSSANPALGTPNGLVVDGEYHVLVADADRGTISRVRVDDGKIEKIADGLEGASGLAWDLHGRLLISDRKHGKIFVIPRPEQKPVLLAEGFQSPSGMCVDRKNHSVLVTDDAAGTLTAVPLQVPGAEVDNSPLPLTAVRAFKNVRWTGWEGETEDGKLSPLRPVVLTHAGDGSNRVFVATEQGVIHVFPNDQKAAETKVFIDLQDRVKYTDKENEEGFLGLAFHPRYKETGEFFVFYTRQKPERRYTNVLSRFRVRPDDPNKADPASEEILLTIEHPFWNHDGGTVAFGPDGYLYLVLGDGGAADDPFHNGQNLSKLLGKLLRIDVDHKENGKPYAIPKDNPFVGRAGARPEIFCYGLRNVWRFSFDRKTGALWAGDVGQDLWEEIDLLVRGGNYGWNLREGLHPFGVHGVGPRPDLIDPIWEYHHSVGKSITGGGVYRGKRLPELDGAYLYADYVTGELRALRYDFEKGRVVENRPIHGPKLPILSFGEDESGEMYFLIVAADGRGIFRFDRRPVK
jgi:glucose/arabinose dehydrogenase